MKHESGRICVGLLLHVTETSRKIIPFRLGIWRLNVFGGKTEKGKCPTYGEEEKALRVIGKCSETKLRGEVYVKNERADFGN
jgi:hypothetical protein